MGGGHFFRPGSNLHSFGISFIPSTRLKHLNPSWKACSSEPALRSRYNTGNFSHLYSGSLAMAVSRKISLPSRWCDRRQLGGREETSFCQTFLGLVIVEQLDNESHLVHVGLPWLYRIVRQHYFLLGDNWLQTFKLSIITSALTGC